MVTHRLVVTGAASTAMLLRVINLLALHDLPLQSVEADVGKDSMRIRIGFAVRAGKSIEPLVERLRAFVEVSAVELGQASPELGVATPGADCAGTGGSLDQPIRSASAR